MSRHVIALEPSVRQTALAGLDAAIAKGRNGKLWLMELREWSRTDGQNKALHGLIAQILKQRPHHFGMRMTMESYKAIFMHAIGREAPMVPNLDGNGFFPMGLSTSKLTVGEFSDLIEYILAWAAREGLTVQHFDGPETDRPRKASRSVAEPAPNPTAQTEKELAQ